MSHPRTPLNLDRGPVEPLSDRGASGEVLNALDNARRTAIRYGAYDIVVVLKCPDRTVSSHTIGNGAHAELAQELRRVADRLHPVDEHGIGEQTRKHLAVALRDALKALEGA